MTDQSISPLRRRMIEDMTLGPPWQLRGRSKVSQDLAIEMLARGLL